uniref:Ig-like domain-containing protein n=1 Tax=Oreochromis aureus TaxID=47969 RepID=A0AAZ1XBW8_OREAU
MYRLTVIGCCAECFLFCLCSVSFPLLDQKNITAESGQNISLPCRAPTNNKQILAVQWSRADLKQEYDRQRKDGDVSLILKNVTINDTGTYECRVFRRGTNHRIRTISLSVVPPCESAEGIGFFTYIWGLFTSLFVVVIFVSMFCFVLVFTLSQSVRAAGPFFFYK